MGGFLLVLLVPFAYLLSVGALDWGPVRQVASTVVRPVLRAAWVRPRASPPRTRVCRKKKRRSGAGEVTMGLDVIPHNFLTGRLEDVVRWARRNSVFPATFGLACCAIEMMATGAAHYDLARYGMEVFRASPRQADLMIVAGRVSRKMAPVLASSLRSDARTEVGDLDGRVRSCGGMFNNYAIVQGVDKIVPVDVYVPGCPPGPETLMHGILTLHAEDRTGEPCGAGTRRPPVVPRSTSPRSTAYPPTCPSDPESSRANDARRRTS